MIVVSTLVTVRSHLITLYPAKRRKEAHKRASYRSITHHRAILIGLKKSGEGNLLVWVRVPPPAQKKRSEKGENI
jgi:hypothetical protein